MHADNTSGNGPGGESNPKRSRRRSTSPPLPAILLGDLLGVIFSVTPGAAAWGVGALAFLQLSATPVLAIAATPFVLVSAFLFTLFALRLALPKLKVGSHKLGLSKGFLTWYCHLALSRAGAISGLQPALQAFSITKVLYWRALGARVGFGNNSSLGVSLTDCGLISVGKGCTLSEGVQISCHTFTGDTLFLGRVEVADNVYIGMNTTIGGRTKIGEGAWIGMENMIYMTQIPAGQRIEDFALAQGRKPAEATRSLSPG